MSWSVNIKNGVVPTLTVNLEVTDCPVCGIIHGFPEDLSARRSEGGGTIYCPNGHAWHYIETEVARQRKRADVAEERLKWARSATRAAQDQADAAEHSARAYKGHLTRMRNRIANGVCPVQGCRRNFADVKAHVLTQHPTWAHEHPEALT
jgi:hypothetical protein